ncbi:archaeosortase/exosortase family protein, partial [Acinetobacter baumannii]
DAWTLPAQQISGWVAFKILQVVQLHPYTSASDPSLILLPHYEMSVGAACSGLKLTLAVLTASVFIAIVGQLKWWKNIVL